MSVASTETVMFCRDCGQPMRRCTDPDNGLRPHNGRGLCRACYMRHWRLGDLADIERRTRSRAELLDDYRLLHSQGHTTAQIADRLGITPSGLIKALFRARGRT